MSKFEDRVNAAAALEMTDRYKALAKLDPEIAKRYVIGGSQKGSVKNGAKLRRLCDGCGVGL